MKILHVAAHLNTGGITTYLQTLIREQTKAGHEVYVWASSGNQLEDFKACSAGVVCDVPWCKSELSPRLWAQLPKFVMFLREHSVEIIHTHTRVAQILTAVATHFVRIPYVSTAHMFYKRRLGRRLFPCWGSAVIAISQTMRDGLMEIFGEENLPPVIVVRNGIDVEALRAKVLQTDRPAARMAYGYGTKSIVALAVSRLVSVKGVHILVDAFAAAHQQIPELRLLIAGTGDRDYVQQLKDQVRTLGLQDAVLFLGNEARIEKPLRAADMFVAPYLWQEAFGLCILEAMAAGLPVIGANVGDVSDLLDHGKRGLLFEKGNIAQLTRCLVDYARNQGLREKISKTCGDAALDYSSSKTYQGIQKVYENVLRPKA